MKKLLAFAVLLTLIVTGCNLNKVTGTTDTPHETKIFVQLSGKYAADEVADVTIGSGGVSTIGKGNPPQAYAAVDPGTYTITATAHNVKGSWSHTVTIEQGQQITVNLPCEDATLIVQPDALWIGTHNRFEVHEGEPQWPVIFTVGAGQSGSTAVHPANDQMIWIADPDSHAAFTTVFHTFFYQEKFTLTLPYR